MSDTQKTLDLMKAALVKSDDTIAKQVSTATGLVAFDLQAPAKNLYPVNTPIRNRMPRKGGGKGVATNWRVVQAILGSGFDAMGWVAEGQRTASIQLTTATKAASYVTLGEEDSVTFEAINAADTFEDILATETMRVLQKMMLKEELAILGGNASLALGTAGTPALSASGAGATLPAATYSVIVVGLTLEGVKNSSVSTGVATSKTITGNDGKTYVLNGGSSNKSANATQAITLGQVLSASTALVTGAVAYAWFVGTVGNEILQSITGINSAVFATPLATGTQAATAITIDASQNSTLAYDGLITTAFKAGAYGASVTSLATGVAGTGTVLTSSGKGTVNEIDALLLNMWNQYQVSPSVIYVNAQQLKDITSRVLTGTSGAPLLQVKVTGDDPQMNPYQLVAGGNVAFYFNPFAMGGGIKIPILIHPNVPAGTIIAYCEDLPAQYKSNNVPNTAEVKLRQDYYQLQWPLRTRAREFGVYCEEVLAVYAPFGIGMITNIAPG
jgi:hypothetical protein